MVKMNLGISQGHQKLSGKDDKNYAILTKQTKSLEHCYLRD